MSDSIYKQHKPGNSDGLYLKLKDGDRVKMRIVSAPAVSTYDGERLRYNWVVLNRDFDKFQVYSAGISVFSQIADLVEEWNEPDGYDIVVKRTGSGLSDTEYSVTPVKTSPDLTETQKAEAEKIDLPNAVKGKWLYQYEQDGEMPEAIKPGGSPPKDEIAPMPEDLGEPISLDEMPPDFLK